MTRYAFGQIVLLNFPFTDGIAIKKRPALVVRDTLDGDLIVCRITSRIYRSEFDIEVADWDKCGLLLPSVIRTHKIATLDTALVQRIMGEASESVKQEARRRLGQLIGRDRHGKPMDAR